MTDSIKIIIEKDSQIVDTSVAVLGRGPGDVPLVDLVAAAFADSYGVHAVADPHNPDADPVPITPWKNVSYHVRQHITRITLDYANKQIDAQAKAQKEALETAALGAVKVVEPN